MPASNKRIAGNTKRISERRFPFAKSSLEGHPIQRVIRALKNPRAAKFFSRTLRAQSNTPYGAPRKIDAQRRTPARRAQATKTAQIALSQFQYSANFPAQSTMGVSPRSKSCGARMKISISAQKNYTLQAVRSQNPKRMADAERKTAGAERAGRERKAAAGGLISPQVN